MDELFKESKEELLCMLTHLNEVAERRKKKEEAKEEGRTIKEEEEEEEEKENNKKETEKLVREIVRISKRLDLIYKVATEGFEKENETLSLNIFNVSHRIFKEIEEKESLLEEAREILRESDLALTANPVREILAYAHKLSTYSKCPLLWTEGFPLEESFPAFPTDNIIQQSILAGEEEKREKKKTQETKGETKEDEKEKKKEKKKKEDEEEKGKEFVFEF